MLTDNQRLVVTAVRSELREVDTIITGAALRGRVSAEVATNCAQRLKRAADRLMNFPYRG